jgi:hypothetical protein
MFKNWKISLIVILGVHLFLLTQLKFTAWPEMLLWPYLLIHGLLPYKDVAMAHTPNLIVELAIVFKLIGVGIVQLKIYTWVLIIITDFLVYWISSKIWNRKIALISAISFVLLQIFFDGNGLWFDSMLAPLALLTFYLVSKKKYFWSGLFWALMFLTKQTAIWFLIPMGLQVIQNTEYKIQNLKHLVFGILTIFAIFIVLLALFGILPDFYNWAVNFGIFILPRASGQIQLPDLRNFLVAVFPFTIFIPFLINKKTRNVNLVLWTAAGVMGTYPRFEYFHFQPALPFLAFVLGIVMVGIKRDKLMKIFLTFYILGSVYLFANYFMRNWKEGTRFYENDVQNLVNYVKQNTNSKDTIFVLNWWDNIYPLTDTLPATSPWVPQLSWYQGLPGVQEKEVENLKTVKPRLIIFKEYEQVGLAAYRPQKVLDFINSNYKLQKKIDNIEILVLR